MKKLLSLLALVSMLCVACSKDSDTNNPDNLPPLSPYIYGTWTGTLTFALPDGTTKTTGEFPIDISLASVNSKILLQIGADKTKREAVMTGNEFSLSYTGDLYNYSGSITIKGSLNADKRIITISDSKIINKTDNKTYNFTGSFKKKAEMPS